MSCWRHGGGVRRAVRFRVPPEACASDVGGSAEVCRYTTDGRYTMDSASVRGSCRRTVLYGRHLYRLRAWWPTGVRGPSGLVWSLLENLNLVPDQIPPVPLSAAAHSHVRKSQPQLVSNQRPCPPRDRLRRVGDARHRTRVHTSRGSSQERAAPG